MKVCNYSGSGRDYSDFTWMEPAPQTPAAVNESQEIEGDIIALPMDVVVPGTCPVIDSTFRSWTLVDACGNDTTITQTIIRVDNTGPVVTCVGTLTVSLDENGEYILDPTELYTDIVDACGSTNFTFEITTPKWSRWAVDLFRN